MEIKTGVPVSPGIAIGTVYLLDSEEISVPKRFIRKDEVAKELERFERCRDATKAEIDEVRRHVHNVVKDEISLIFEAHIRILEDPTLNEEIRDRIRKDRFAPEYAVARVFRKLINAVKALDDSYFAQRVSDFTDIQRRLLRALMEHQRATATKELDGQVVIVAHDLTPSQTASLDRRHVVAFATDLGGSTSHTAILANALGIPAVVGLGAISRDISGGETIIIDGTRGRVFISPDDATKKKYELLSAEHHSRKTRIVESAGRLADETADGTPIGFFANVEFDSEVEAAVRNGAAGIGLYRTEFIYARHEHPGEEDHFNAIVRSIRALGDRPLTVRTLDFGADKFRESAGLDAEDNPFLGNRSLRLCLKEPEVFRTQLRAILRASVFGRLRLMFPMVSSLEELRGARQHLDEVREELRAANTGFDERMPVGIMVEVPSAAIMADKLAAECDFFSIGTNDLVQYTLAVDRNNPAVGHLYQHAHPAVLALIKRVIDAGAAHNIPVSVCGEMASAPHMAVLLIGLGVRHFSTAPSAIPRLKMTVNRVTIEQAEHIAADCLTSSTSRQVEDCLRASLEVLLGEVIA